MTRLVKYGAAFRGNLDFLELLLRYGADVDGRRDDSNTALHTVHDGKNGITMVSALLKAGGD